MIGSVFNMMCIKKPNNVIFFMRIFNVELNEDILTLARRMLKKRGKSVAPLPDVKIEEKTIVSTGDVEPEEELFI